MKNRLPAEWEEQDFVQLTWPNQNGDWANSYHHAQLCFAEIARTIIKFQKVLIVSQKPEETASFFTNLELNKIRIVELFNNDSWARDHGGITVSTPDGWEIQDYYFNGWGKKFPSALDNKITYQLFKKDIFKAYYKDCLDFVLEGGAIESNGNGTLLTTEKCLLNSNRNPNFNKKQIERLLNERLGIKRFLWLRNGDLIGDDTDAHIDTLARFCSENTIAYVKCSDEHDAHYHSLQLMESELKNFEQTNGLPFELIPLPMPSIQLAFEGSYRLPATYANFLIINGAVLVPIYDCKEDDLALKKLQLAFPTREVIGINCIPLIQQHGSLHCVTMQYPKGVL